MSYIIVSVVSGILFAILDGVINANPLAQRLYEVYKPAIKFRGKEPPRVHVSADLQSNEWRVSLRDNGIGVDPQYAERIFVIFQRLHNREEYPHGYQDRPGHMQKDCVTPWRTHLGGVAGGPRGDVLFHATDRRPEPTGFVMLETIPRVHVSRITITQGDRTACKRLGVLGQCRFF